MRLGYFIKSRLGVYQREFSIVIMGGVLLFIMASIFSYNPEDHSWFFFSTVAHTTTNWCGIVGANLAALLWYLFGTGVWFFCVCLLTSFWILISHDALRACWERIAALILAPCIVSAALTAYHSRASVVATNGGLIGLKIYTALYPQLGMVGLYIFLITSMMVLTVIAVRLSAARFKQLKRIFRAAVQVAWSTSRLMVHAVYYAGHRVYQYGKQQVGTLYNRFLLSKQQIMIPADDCLFEQTLGASQEYGKTSAQHDQVSLADQIPEPQPEHSVQNAHDQTSTQSVDEYVLPSLSLFIAHEKERTSPSVKQELEQRARLLEEKLRHFGISGSVIEIKRGPVVSVFEYLPAIDTKLSKIVSLEDDLAMALQALSIRILAPIPGKAVVGFEVANKKRHEVLFSEVIKSVESVSSTISLPLVLGKDTIGTDVVVDLARMPHLLIAGSTGSGKSVALNAMLISLLCRRTPDEMRLILIDPKRLEFASYADIAHLLFPIVTDPKAAAPVLRWVVHEMEQRYERMASCGVRSMADYNRCTRHAAHADPLPYIVVIIDELSDLMMTASKEVEDLITRITQMARAAGIHMIVATQRPSVDVITGLIKVNFPSRISFRVTSKIDSRTILDCVGADKLLGHGDMLFLDAAHASLSRIHGAYISTAEIEAVVNHIKSKRAVQYLQLEYETHDDQQLNQADDHLFAQVVDFLHDTDEISISLLQRRFKIGYNRSARIIEFLETKGMILPADGSKTRKVVR